MQTLEAEARGRLGVHILDTADGASYGYRADERFQTLSSFKFLASALVLALPSWLIFGNPARLPHTAVQWGVLVWMGLFATALGMFWWVKGSTRVDAGALAVMNELHVPLGLLVNLLIWNRDADLKKIALGGGVILLSLVLNRIGRVRGAAPAT